MARALSNKTKVTGTSFLLFCLSLFLTSYSAKHPEVAHAGASLLESVISPVESLNRGAWSSITGTIDEYFFIIGVKDENKELKKRLETLEAKNSKLLEIESENRRLRSLFEVRSLPTFRGEIANVIGRDPSNWVQTVTIDKGSNDGLREGMIALHGDGVVGQIVMTAPRSSKLLLLTDHASAVDVLAQSNRTQGLVVGAGAEHCEMRFVSREEKLEVGERIITSGMDGLYPKGLLVGIVANIEKRSNGLFQFVDIKPSVDFSRLETMLIVTGFDKNADLEPKPTPAPVESPKKEEKPAVKADKTPAKPEKTSAKPEKPTEKLKKPAEKAKEPAAKPSVDKKEPPAVKTEEAH